MDSTTIELVTGKFTDVEEIKRIREQRPKEEKKGNISGGIQERGEIKRDKLKKYSVFAK